MASGEFVEWTVRDYETEVERVRSSDVKLLIKDHGPAQFKWVRENRKPLSMDRVDAGGKVLGILAHEYIIEGKQEWFVSESRQGSKKWAEERAENGGKFALKQSQHDMLVGQRDAVMKNPECRRIIEESFVEKTILFEVAGIECKARLDLLGMDASIWDLKTSRFTTRTKFERQIIDYGYDTSMAFYQLALACIPEYEGISAPCGHIYVNKEEPFYAYAWPLHESFLNVGRHQIKRAFGVLEECLATDEWPDLLLETQSAEVAAPDWYLSQQGFREQNY